MIAPPIPSNEASRLLALYDYSILDTITDPDFDNLVRIASEVCQTPISSISLIDKNRQWFKARYGLKDSETPRNEAFCAHAINEPDKIMVVENAALDPRFHDNPGVLDDPHIAFYAGVPLVNDDGLALGTICVVDQVPRKLTADQEETLKALSRQVMNLLELRRKRKQLEDTMAELQQMNQQLEKFALIVAHDIRSPLGAISGLAQHISSSFSSHIDEEMKETLNILCQSSSKVINLVDGILEYSRNSSLDLPVQEFDANQFFEDLKLLFPTLSPINLQIHCHVGVIKVNGIALKQVLLNLVTNAIKYNDKEIVEIHVHADVDDLHYVFRVSDNGIGIRQDDLDKIFEIFTRVHPSDRFGKEGTGIGLATVKNLIANMKGEISVSSTPGIGSVFEFRVPR